ncbi:MAG TPA: TIGR01458 family HAD-type hydrolase [bacterium]|nr:TIGR01458 family HAD-type hydrolase [bacterium]
MGVLLDIDGTVLAAGHPLPGAADAIARLRDAGVPLLFATNTSRKSREAVAGSLRDAGIPVEPGEVLSAGHAAAVLLRGEGVRRVHLLLTPDARRDWDGFDDDDASPEAVVVGDLGTHFDFDTLNRAFRHLAGGARLVATQKNRFWHAADGPTLDAGAFVAALEYAARTEALVVGKPAPDFFHLGAEILGRPVESLLIVGDDLESDVAGGRAAGLETCLVRTGKFDAERLAASATPPDHVIDSIADVPDLLLR